jgi:hypothetical protein
MKSLQLKTRVIPPTSACEAANELKPNLFPIQQNFWGHGLFPRRHEVYSGLTVASSRPPVHPAPAGDA